MGQLKSKFNKSKEDEEITSILKESKKDAFKRIELANKCLVKEEWNDAKIHLCIAFNALQIYEDLKLSSMVESEKKEKKKETLEKIQIRIMYGINTIEENLKRAKQIEESNKEEERHWTPRRLPLYNFDGYTKEDINLIGPVIERFSIQNPEVVKWDDIIGCEEAKFAFKSISNTFFDSAIAPLYDKGIYRRKKGVLLFGPPGTG